MADDEVTPLTTTTTNYGFVKPDVGASDDLWGGLLNTDLDNIDSTIKSVSTVANAAYPAANPSGYQTAANVTASLGPYATTSSVTTALASYQPLAGVIDGSNAAVGQIGEVISSNVTTAGQITLSNGVAANVTSISLTAGDWNVFGEVWIQFGSTAGTSAIASINNTSATLAGNSSLATARVGLITTFTASQLQVFSLRPCRISLSATQTQFLVAFAGFSPATVTAYGNIIARRLR